MSEKTEMLALADEIEDATQPNHVCDLMLSIKERKMVIAALRAAGAEPVGYGYSAEIQSAHGMHLHVSREKAGVYDTPLFLAAIPAPAPASGRECATCHAVLTDGSQPAGSYEAFEAALEMGKPRSEQRTISQRTNGEAIIATLQAEVADLRAQLADAEGRLAANRALVELRDRRLSCARKITIEECAKIADGWLSANGSFDIQYVSAKQYASDAVKDIADVIRSLAQECAQKTEQGETT